MSSRKPRGSCRGASQALRGVGKEDSESAREENRMESSEVQSVYSYVRW